MDFIVLSRFIADIDSSDQSNGQSNNDNVSSRLDKWLPKNNNRWYPLSLVHRDRQTNIVYRAARLSGESLIDRMRELIDDRQPIYEEADLTIITIPANLIEAHSNKRELNDTIETLNANKRLVVSWFDEVCQRYCGMTCPGSDDGKSTIFISGLLMDKLMEKCNDSFSCVPIRPVRSPVLSVHRNSKPGCRWCELFLIVKGSRELLSSRPFVMSHQASVPVAYGELTEVIKKLGFEFNILGYQDEARAVAFAWEYLSGSGQVDDPINIMKVHLKDKIEGIPKEPAKEEARIHRDKVLNYLEYRDSGERSDCRLTDCMERLKKIEKLLRI